MMVAEGAAEIAVDPEVTLWDLAAVSIVVEEAGGRFTSLAGARRPGGGSGLASNGAAARRGAGVLRWDSARARRVRG